LQEYYIRHLGDSAGSSGEDRDRLRRALEAAIERRYTEVLLLAQWPCSLPDRSIHGSMLVMDVSLS